MREALLHAPPLKAGARFWVAAVGKAAPAMALGARDALGGTIERTLVISRDAQSLAALAGLTTVDSMLGDHPVPGEGSLAAGRQLLDFVDALPPHAEALFLISGGASSLVEVPREGVTLEDLVSLTRWALAEGIAIGELNARRAALSSIKGGGLATRLRGRPARALFLSDVPRDDPRVIGSGLMGPASEGPDRVERQVLASVDDAVAAVAAAAREYGLRVGTRAPRFAGGAMRLAARFVRRLREGRAQLLVWGGESTVELPANPGEGGRNQHLALAAARLIANDERLLLLAAGTDGTDGVTADAGALVDGATCARLASAELDAAHCLAAADSARALAASGDLVHTGPTGTNVGDLLIGLKLSPVAAQRLLRRHGGPRSRVL